MNRFAVAALLAAGPFSALFSLVSHAAEAQRVWLEVAPGRMPAVAKTLSREREARIAYRFDELDAFVITAPDAVVERLRQNRSIRSIQADAKRYPMAQEVPYGIDLIKAREVWDFDRDGTIDPGAATGAGRTVCIIDSGIAADHEDLSGLQLVGGVPDGWDTDSCGHGSHVAGTIAAVNNQLGVVGVSPGAVDVFVVKVFDGAACGWSYASSLVNAAFQCRAAGADVINMSLGGGRPIVLENRAFERLAANGILSVAAAGNDGNTRKNYPASYDSVVSVAAVDESSTVADFSQQNDAVELAAPGVGVLSTVPFALMGELEVAGEPYEANPIEFAALGSASGALADGGLCTAAGSWSGLVVLCERGDISFADKVAAAEAGGAVAVAIYNNEPGGFLGTLGEGGSSTIPAVSLSQEDGSLLAASAIGLSATVTAEEVENTYAYYNGTSMATPHVAGAAAVLLSSSPTMSAEAVRQALQATATDLGAPGIDDAYGYGLIDLFAAWQYLGAGASAIVASPAADVPQGRSTR